MRVQKNRFGRSIIVVAIVVILIALIGISRYLNSLSLHKNSRASEQSNPLSVLTPSVSPTPKLINIDYATCVNAGLMPTPTGSPGATLNNRQIRLSLTNDWYAYMTSHSSSFLVWRSDITKTPRTYEYVGTVFIPLSATPLPTSTAYPGERNILTVPALSFPKGTYVFFAVVNGSSATLDITSQLNTIAVSCSGGSSSSAGSQTSKTVVIN